MSVHTLIVGGTRGMGREVVRQMQAECHTVSVIGRRAPIDVDKKLSDVRFWTADIADGAKLPALLEGVISHGGPISYLVFFQRYRGDGDKWIGEIETSLTATKNIIEGLLPYFAQSADQAIVLVGSIAVDHIVSEQPVGYHVAKAGLRHMASYYAVTLGERGIRVNCVSPCVIVKDENRGFYASNQTIADVYKRIIPLGRMGTAQDSANVISFLCSPKAGFVTGQQIVVDGGVSLLSQESLSRKISGI